MGEGIERNTILLRDDRDGVATLTLNRPRQFNALSQAMLDALQCAVDAIAADASVRVVVLAGAGKARACRAVRLGLASPAPAK